MPRWITTHHAHINPVLERYVSTKPVKLKYQKKEDAPIKNHKIAHYIGIG